MQDDEWAAPLLWRSELRNVLALYLRKKMLALGEAVQVMEEATMLMSGREYETVWAEVLRLAGESTCSAYDCEFVALARDLGVKLLAVDRRILREFPAGTVSLDAYVD